MMQKIQDMAKSIFGDSDSKPSAEPKNLPAINNLSDGDIGSVMKIMSLLKNGREDSGRANLLMALKPHLSAERRDKVDSAIKLLKIIEILPLLKEQGLLDKLF